MKKIRPMEQRKQFPVDARSSRSWRGSCWKSRSDRLRPMNTTRVVSLNRPMKVLTMPGIEIFSAWGSTIRRNAFPVIQAQRVAGPRIAPWAAAAKPATHHFGDIGGREQGHHDDHPQQQVEGGARRQEVGSAATGAVNSQTISGTPRMISMKATDTLLMMNRCDWRPRGQP